MAIAALVFGFLLPPIGIVMGHIALSQIRRTGESGRGIAIAALVVGYTILLVCGCGLPLFLTM
jgi:peptidyl-prolyl cis-trans isomerase B (cyclophilin B)